jgi:hypothetical protein
MNLKPISLKEAKDKIQKECGERLSAWMDNAKWFLCSLNSDEFKNLLVYYNGPQRGWQLLTPDSSSRISDVAKALREYDGSDRGLMDSKTKVSEYEKKIDSIGYFQVFCLCRVGTSGRITLFETNHRALALYWHCFLLPNKGEFPMISESVLGEVSSKQPFQFE